MRDLPVEVQGCTWSNYEHNNTVKPDFKRTTRVHLNLKGWEEGVIKKKVSEESGYLDNLLPVDIVLANESFDK